MEGAGQGCQEVEEDGPVDGIWRGDGSDNLSHCLDEFLFDFVTGRVHVALPTPAPEPIDAGTFGERGQT